MTAQGKTIKVTLLLVVSISAILTAAYIQFQGVRKEKKHGVSSITILWDVRDLESANASHEDFGKMSLAGIDLTTAIPFASKGRITREMIFVNDTSYISFDEATPESPIIYLQGPSAHANRSAIVLEGNGKIRIEWRNPTELLYAVDRYILSLLRPMHPQVVVKTFDDVRDYFLVFRHPESGAPVGVYWHCQQPMELVEQLIPLLDKKDNPVTEEEIRKATLGIFAS